MNILITGANGFIGKNLSKYLGKEHTIFNFALGITKESGINNQIALDLTSIRKVKQYFDNFIKKNKVDVIIHLATRLASENEIENIRFLYYNLKITESIVMMAKLLKPKKLINFSSIAVYPNKDGLFSELSEIRPSLNSDCLYGLAKFCSENIIDFMLRKENIVILHLRISQVYGKGMREDRIIPVMLKELREKNSITLFSEGKRVSNFIPVEKLIKIVSSFLKMDRAGIFNIGDENLSYLELAQRLIKQYGDKNSKIINKQEGSRAKFYLDTIKIDELDNIN